MKREVLALVFTCDNPACGTEFSCLQDADLPRGYYIPKGVLRTDGRGGADAKDREIFACSEECLTPAILGAFER